MRNVKTSDVRNFALLGHTGSGKTTLIDNMLYKLGTTERQGSPQDGTSASDYTEEEKNHQVSIWATPFEATYKNKDGETMGIVAIDTPGYADFTGQMIAATTVCDSAMIVVDAASGIQVGTNRAWRRCESLTLPRGIVINGIDRENADYEATLAAIQEVWGNKCFPVTIPAPDNSEVVNVLEAQKAPESIAERARDLKGQLVEFAAETDDSLIEKYLEGEDLTPEEISEGLHGAVRDGSLIPVFAVSGAAHVGIEELLEGISLLYPSPEDCPHKDAEGNPIKSEADGPFSGLVWRTVNDPYVGQLSFVRVFSGTLTKDTDVFNVTRDHKEKVGHIYIMNGRDQQEIEAAHPGDIIALPKLKDTGINDSLSTATDHIHFAPIEFPNPVAAYAIEPKSRGDEDKMATALARITDEDPTLTIERNDETGEFIFSGMGDLQIDIALERMKSRGNVEVDLHTPKVAYKETIQSNGEGHYRHKKQSGGRGQFGEVYLRVSPKPPEEEEWFVNSIVGGAIPKGFIPAVQKGLVEGLQRGALAGYPVVNTRIELYDGSYHDVDSSEVAFKIAAARALSDGMTKASPVLLEPIMHVRIFVPDEFMGDVNGEINHKRGRIQGMGSEGGLQVVEADVPQAEMFRFSSELRSMTQGRGSFEMEFSRYEIVPQNIAKGIIDAARQKDEHE